MFLEKRKLVEALKCAKIPYKQTSDATVSISNRMGDFRRCPYCNNEIFSATINFPMLVQDKCNATLKYVEINPQINNNPEFLSALVLECKNCNNTIWRHFSITEI